MKQTVVGMFNTASEAQQAVQQLKSNGFNDSDIDLSTANSTTESTGMNTNFGLDKNDDHESGVTKFFKNLFGSDDDTDATRYSNAATRGSSIVTVHAQSGEEAQRAADLLDDYGAIDVDDDADNDDSVTGIAPVGMFNETTGVTAMTPDTDVDTTTGTFDMANKGTSANMADTTGKTSIPIIEEQMNVGKRTVETGGARIRSRIVERPVEENLRLREERVYVNRNPVNRAATSNDFDTFKEGEIELRETAEVPVVSKEARVVEEVSLGKEVNERNETVRDTVRKTEVDVEELSKTNTTSSDSSASINRKDN